MQPTARLFGKSVLIACVAAMFANVAGPASARPVCRDGFQIIDGRKLATPYCSDLYLAQVAREFGSKVSAREIRNNPSTKREVCEFVGQDIRVKPICDMVLPRRGF